MSGLAKGVFIVAAKRTAFGTFGGAFKNTSQTQLQTVAAQAALTASGLRPEQVDSTVIGNVISVASTDGIYLARHVGLHCGIPIDRPALTVNRLCGSGFQSVVNGAQEILLGNSKVVLTGGVENMTQTPFVVRSVRFGTALGAKYNFEDTLWDSLTDSYCKTPMGMTAENLAVKYQLTKDEVDEFALRSQQNWKRAQDEGVFKTEIAPTKLKIKGKEVDFAIDEHPRPQTTMDSLKKLPTIFKKDGTVSAGSASGVSDGAAAVIVASEAACKEYNLKPLARLVAYSAVGVQPDIMGIGPVPSIQNVLKLTGLSLNDIDIIEINEAFGSQTLACAKELKLDMSKLNPNGGAIALGHPLAASGSRITGHLVHELQRKKLKYAIGSACIGGGQAQDEGVFKTEIAPTKLKIKGKEVDFAIDEHPRPQTTMDSLKKLPTIFKKDGTVSAGSASGVSDGAAAVIVASEAACKEYNLKPLARLVAYSAVGVQPDIMGIGPVPSIQNVLKLTGLSLNDIDIIEINEAFGSQTLACAKELKLDMSKLNPNGGAIALGHPLAASGSRITGHLVHELQRKKLKYAIGSACIGGGQGIAVLLESV